MVQAASGAAPVFVLAVQSSEDTKERLKMLLRNVPGDNQRGSLRREKAQRGSKNGRCGQEAGGKRGDKTTEGAYSEPPCAPRDENPAVSEVVVKH